ncbi:putative pre-mRNA-processing factor 40 [Cryptosporidium felis]|nr:putative pre-mRNA-processing factor 40 [Cryptosporidium felis]
MEIDKKDAIQLVKKYFEKAELNPKLRWDEAAKLMGSDAPNEALKFLSTGEKRQLWSEYQSQSKRRKRERERQTKSESITIYREFLNEWILKNQDCNSLLLFHDFAESHNKYDWWSNIEEKEKDDIFQEVVEEYEKKFENNLVDNYERNIELCSKLLKKDLEIHLPLILEGNSESMNDMSGIKLWESIQKRHENEGLFKKLFNNDIVDIYIKTLRETIYGFRDERIQNDIQLSKYRRMFWEIVKGDILSGKISPITKSRTSYFFTSTKITDGMIEKLNRVLHKWIRNNLRTDKCIELLQDFLRFISFHLSIKKDQKVILALLKQPIGNKKNIHCIDMFIYVTALLQKLYDRILLESRIPRLSKNSKVSFQQFKEMIHDNGQFEIDSNYVFPFNIESILDTLFYKVYCDEFRQNIGSAKKISS